MGRQIEKIKQEQLLSNYAYKLGEDDAYYENKNHKPIIREFNTKNEQLAYQEGKKHSKKW